MVVITEDIRFRQGAGRLCLDFLRTLRYRGSPDAVEELPDASALAAWVRQFQPNITAVAPSEPSLVGEAHALRESVHAMIKAARGAPGLQSCPDSARRRVNRAAAQPLPMPSLTSSGQLRWHSDDPVTATLASIARDALDLATSPAVTRVRDCANPHCGVLFLDNSRPGTRRWCSMDTCGNRAKKDTLRHKNTA